MEKVKSTNDMGHGLPWLSICSCVCVFSSIESYLRCVPQYPGRSSLLVNLPFYVVVVVVVVSHLRFRRPHSHTISPLNFKDAVKFDTAVPHARMLYRFKSRRRVLFHPVSNHRDFCSQMENRWNREKVE